MERLEAFSKELFKRPLYIALAAGAVGLILGLVIGWGIFPVQWTDASAEHLREDLRIDYLRNAITTFTLTNDAAKAAQQYQELGTKAEDTLEKLIAAPGFLNSEQISRFSKAINLDLNDASSQNDTGAVTGTNDESIIESDNTKESGGLLWLGFGLLGVLVVGAFLVYWFFFREQNLASAKSVSEITSEHRPAAVPARQPAAVPARKAAAEVSVENKPETGKVVEKSNGRANGNGKLSNKPIAQFMTTYMFGDDLYDESFTFDAPNGEFLGECGVSISDIVGVGEPKKISAFEVWLFDKNDVQTVTKVLMSKHAFNDANIRQRLELRGEPIMSEAGKQFMLETATLRLEARLIDLSYGDLPLPAESYYQRTTVELAVYRK